MAKNISLLGANYPDVPAVQLPQTGGGTATYYDINVVDNLNSSSATDALSANQGKTLNDKLMGMLGLNSISSVASLSDFQSKVDALIPGDGFYTIRLTNSNASGAGLANAAHLGFVMCNDNNKLIVMFRLNGTEIKTISKMNGSWNSAWKTYSGS